MRVYRLLGIVLLSFFMAPVSVFAGDKTLIFAVHPYLPEHEILRRFTPFAEYLTRETGYPVVIRVGGDYEQHITAIGMNQVDLAFLGPAAYVKVVETYGEKPLLARFEVSGNSHLFGVIATQKNSPIQSLSDLADKRFAFGDPQSTMSYMVPRYMLIKAGITKGLADDYQFLGSHNNVALGILTGDFDAGAMKKEVFEEFETRGLRALAVTPGVPDHLFVASDKMRAGDVEKLKVAMMKLKDQPDGLSIMKDMHPKLTSLVAADNHDYDELRKMIRVVTDASR